ncbi:MAG: hypothetical protein E5Y03_21240 [Mesorhizobium sp.]|nr:MAG: hypothetical protein EOS01_15510 [Mesorhizobium sp.]RWO14146.1 MAG: hypothetical protein EOS15_16485 [Mesorhizobium sp.]TIN99602.1 MAG: hypothetical protein E5Y03_21240 [Mesorhizobium sp.]
MFGVCAAPHRPAGHVSPYSDGEKDAFAKDFANRPGLQKERQGRGQLLSPRLRGEMPGRAMRGGACFRQSARTGLTPPAATSA